jgi:outer membrane protein assembly factor BamB
VGEKPHLSALAAREGTVLWSRNLREDLDLELLPVGIPARHQRFQPDHPWRQNFHFIRSGSALLHLAEDGVTVVWQHRNLMRNYFNPSVLVDGYLYGIDGTTHRSTALTCLNVNTGELQWSEPGFGSGALKAAGDKLILLDRGELIIVKASPEQFTPLARAQVTGGKCWTVPVLPAGEIYCRNAAGQLVRVALHKE